MMKPLKIRVQSGRSLLLRSTLITQGICEAQDSVGVNGVLKWWVSIIWTSRYPRYFHTHLGSLPDLSMCAHHLWHAVPIFFSWRNKQLVYCRRKCCSYLLLSGSYSIFQVALVGHHLFSLANEWIFSAWILHSFRRVTSRVGFSPNSQKFSHLDPTLCISPSTCTLKLRSALEHAMIGTTIRWGFSKFLRKWRQPPHMISNWWSGFCAKVLLHETLCIHKGYNAESAMVFYWLYFWGIRKVKGHQR